VLDAKQDYRTLNHKKQKGWKMYTTGRVTINSYPQTKLCYISENFTGSGLYIAVL